jgi:hypothetical protein
MHAARASSWLEAVALAFTLAACGARTDLELSQPMPPVAGGSSSSVGDAGTAGGAPLIDPAVCAAFLPRWHQRAEDTTANCEYCLVYGACPWPNNVAACQAGTHCVADHCTTVETADALCSCIEDCLAPAPKSCDARWSQFMVCATDTCAVACPSHDQ